MSGTIVTLVVLGVVVVGFIKRCDWLGICDGSSSAPILPSSNGDSTIPANAKTTPAAMTPTGNCLGPANFGDEGPDLGFGFSKDGGPIQSNGLSKNGEPRVGDNSNKANQTICQLPGPCETKLYKGMIQYRHAGLSASADTCDHAKQYFLYKYGLGGGNAAQNAATHDTGNIGSGGGNKHNTTNKKKSKKRKSHYTFINQNNNMYSRIAI